MSKPQKIITIVLWVVAVSVMLGVLAMKTLPPNSPPSTQPVQIPGQVITASADPPDAPPPVMYSAPSFRLIDQDAQPATNVQLLGHPWVADFIFTTCATLCPTMSAHMAELQNQLPDDVKLVSFSVDPGHDNPAALKQYADRYHAQNGRWIFLTSDEKTQEQVIRGMKLGFVPAQGGNPIQHDEHFILVDSQGRIRGYYDALVPQRLQQLVHDARMLSAQGNGG
ncbi:MAG TPA: SCO family protein [Tepidisphaeraceae bacterium]|jgi:protein SCO1/2|nr:SCO family protein [Tepidisphaeraceae bacterium]